MAENWDKSSIINAFKSAASTDFATSACCAGQADARKEVKRCLPLHAMGWLG
jgi:hypothetical protein